MSLMPNDYPNIQELTKLINSPAGKEIIELLRNQGSKQLYQAAKKAADGDTKDFEHSIQNLLATPEAAAILKQLGGI